MGHALAGSAMLESTGLARRSAAGLDLLAVWRERRLDARLCHGRRRGRLEAGGGRDAAELFDREVGVVRRRAPGVWGEAPGGPGSRGWWRRSWAWSASGAGRSGEQVVHDYDLGAGVMGEADEAEVRWSPGHPLEGADVDHEQQGAIGRAVPKIILTGTVTRCVDEIMSSPCCGEREGSFLRSGCTGADGRLADDVVALCLVGVWYRCGRYPSCRLEPIRGRAGSCGRARWPMTTRMSTVADEFEWRRPFVTINSAFADELVEALALKASRDALSFADEDTCSWTLLPAIVAW